jgi:hypothetical protein
MAALTDISDLINRASGGNSGTPQNQFWFKAARIAGAAATANIAGRPASLWTYDGQPGGGVAPTAVAAPDNTTAGALPFNSAGGSRQSWMTQAWATGLVGGTLILYDRLLHIGGLSGTVTTAQTVGGSLTRNTGGAGNIVFAEIYTIIGTTARTITMEYTDQSGNTGQTSTAVAIGATGFREQTRAIFLPLAAGDTGVRAVASVTLSATTGTAGNFGITVGKPIGYIGIGAAGAPGWRDYVTGLPGIPEIEAGACLSLLWVPVSTTVPEIFGGYSIVEA